MNTPYPPPPQGSTLLPSTVLLDFLTITGCALVYLPLSRAWRCRPWSEPMEPESLGATPEGSVSAAMVSTPWESYRSYTPGNRERLLDDCLMGWFGAFRGSLSWETEEEGWRCWPFNMPFVGQGRTPREAIMDAAQREDRQW